MLKNEFNYYEFKNNKNEKICSFDKKKAKVELKKYKYFQNKAINNALGN